MSIRFSADSRAASHAFVIATVIGSTWTPQAWSQDGSAQDIAQQLANPVASLVSVPLQLNYDRQIGASDTGDRITMNLQPVVPVSLNENWNLISRTIIPFINQKDIFLGSGSQAGIGDIVQSVFFSPVQPTDGGWIWGAGPVLLAPTGADDLLTADQWGLGPTAVALRQQGQWTYGALVNHIWSIADGRENDRPDVNSTFLQPFATYTTPRAVSISVAAEATYDWGSKEWSVPLAVTVAKVVNFGDQLVNMGGGLRYYASSPPGGPESLGLRFSLTFLYPK